MLLRWPPFLKCSVPSALICLLGFTAGFTKDQWRDAIQSLEMDYNKDQYLNDNGDLAALHTSDVIMMPSGFPAVYGIENYREALKDNRTGEDMYWLIQTTNELLVHTDKFAVIRYECDFKYTPEMEIKTGKGVFILEKIDGNPLLSLSIWNFNT